MGVCVSSVLVGLLRVVYSASDGDFDARLDIAMRREKRQ